MNNASGFVVCSTVETIYFNNDTVEITTKDITESFQ